MTGPQLPVSAVPSTSITLHFHQPHVSTDPVISSWLKYITSVYFDGDINSVQTAEKWWEILFYGSSQKRDRNLLLSMKRITFSMLFFSLTWNAF
jgi:hypothetical protein